MADKHGYLNRYPILGPHCGAVPLVWVFNELDGKILFDRYRYF